MAKNSLSNDITEIKTRLGYITATLADMKECNDRAELRFAQVEKSNAVLENKVGAIAIFQSSFSVIVGAIASFLGTRK